MLKKNILKVWLSIFLVTLTGIIWADDVANSVNITYAPSVKVAGQQLILNGNGIRKKLFFKVYTLGLYVSKKGNSTDELVQMAGPKLVEIRMLRNVDAKTFVEALHEGLEDNNSDDVLKTLKPQINKLEWMMIQTAKAKSGDIIKFIFNPANGTEVSLNGKALGTIDGGATFYSAILNIWLGRDPVDRGLKIDILNIK